MVAEKGKGNAKRAGERAGSHVVIAINSTSPHPLARTQQLNIWKREGENRKLDSVGKIPEQKQKRKKRISKCVQKGL